MWLKVGWTVLNILFDSEEEASFFEGNLFGLSTEDYTAIRRRERELKLKQIFCENN